MSFNEKDSAVSLLDSLISEIMGKSQSTSSQQGEASLSPGGYKAPIHGQWFNLGGFNPTMARYDDLAKDPKATKGRGHFGVDMGASAGTPVYAMSNGVVSAATTDKMGGNIVGVTHADGLWSYYAHLSTISVHKGDHVGPDTVIGTVGNTGNAGNPKDPLTTQEGGRTWPHLHFGVKKGGQWVDPAQFFSIPKYDAKFAANPKKYINFWASDKAREEAQAFNIQQHNQSKKLASGYNASQLLQLANKFYKLAIR